MQNFRVNVTSPVGTWGVEGHDAGVARILMPTERGRASSGRAPSCVAEAAAQLEEYFGGSRRDFDVQFAEVESTSFQRDIWSTLIAIPYGEVRTYAQVAASVRRPRAARAVGNANHANPWPIIVPCHRVVAATGLGGYGGGVDVKRYLLDLEGVREP